MSEVNLPKMRTAFLNLYLLSRSLMTFGVTVATRTSASSQACTSIQAALPGKVFYPGPCPSLPHGPNIHTYLPISLATGSETYSEDIAHSTSSAEQNSTCAVNPSSVDDLSTIVRRFFCPFKRSYLTLLNVFQIKIIGRDDIRAPFAVSPQFFYQFLTLLMSCVDPRRRTCIQPRVQFDHRRPNSDVELHFSHLQQSSWDGICWKWSYLGPGIRHS